MRDNSCTTCRQILKKVIYEADGMYDKYTKQHSAQPVTTTPPGQPSNDAVKRMQKSESIFVSTLWSMQFVA